MCVCTVGLSSRTRGTRFFSVPSASQCLQCLGSHSHGAAAINIHQVLEKEGVLLLNYNLLLAEGIDCQIYKKLLLFQIPCPVHCRDGKRWKVSPILLWWRSATDSTVTALELYQWNRREEFASWSCCQVNLKVSVLNYWRAAPCSAGPGEVLKSMLYCQTQGRVSGSQLYAFPSLILPTVLLDIAF